jgi:hypothetical protein
MSPVSTQNHRSLRSTNIEKHFKVPQKVIVLASIYFSITRESIDKRGREKEKHFMTHAGNGSKDTYILIFKDIMLYVIIY